MSERVASKVKLIGLLICAQSVLKDINEHALQSPRDAYSDDDRKKIVELCEVIHGKIGVLKKLI